MPTVGAVAELNNLKYLNEAVVFTKLSEPMFALLPLIFVAFVEAAEMAVWYRDWETDRKSVV